MYCDYINKWWGNVKGNSGLLSLVGDLTDISSDISEDTSYLEGISEISLDFAKTSLDYKMLADKVLLQRNAYFGVS